MAWALLLLSGEVEVILILLPCMVKVILIDMLESASWY